MRLGGESNREIVFVFVRACVRACGRAGEARRGEARRSCVGEREAMRCGS